jgi:ethanolamine utilization protein EutA
LTHLGDAPQLSDSDIITLHTVGIDVGSSTSHFMFCRLWLLRQNQTLSSRFAIRRKEVLYRSPIWLTPYAPDNTIDVAVLSGYLEESYGLAGLNPSEIDTGAVILTGEAIKRHNARAIANLFASQSGKFVCASAGHHLEAVLAAHGSGAVTRSRDVDGPVLHIDVGGGTTKLTLLQQGVILQTAAINVGGRLLACDEHGSINRIEDAAQIVAEDLQTRVCLGEPAGERLLEAIADRLADVLMDVVTGEQQIPLAAKLTLTEPLRLTERISQYSFSGGVAEYIYGSEKTAFDDLGMLLGAAVRQRFEKRCLWDFVADSDQCIRATVIGASQYTVQVSGNTLFVSDAGLLPRRNLPVVPVSLPVEAGTPGAIVARLKDAFRQLDLTEGETDVALVVRWNGEPSFTRVDTFAKALEQGLTTTWEKRRPLFLIFDRDVGRLIGRILKREFRIANEIVSVDGLQLREFDFIDLGEVLQPSGCVPVVIKSLVFSSGQTDGDH